jgi:hypothetical protein
MGEHFAVALYPDAAAFYQFLELEETGGKVSPEAALEIPQLQASFEDRNMLHQQDRDTIKSLGLKFRGRNAWPMFRTYRPGLATIHRPMNRYYHRQSTLCLASGDRVFGCLGSRVNRRTVPMPNGMQSFEGAWPGFPIF